MIDPYGVSVAGAPVVLATVPPGPSSVVITNAGAVTLYVGAGTAASTGAGAPVPASGVVPMSGFATSSATKLWGITSGGTVTAGVFISTGS